MSYSHIIEENEILRKLGERRIMEYVIPAKVPLSTEEHKIEFVDVVGLAETKSGEFALILKKGATFVERTNGD